MKGIAALPLSGLIITGEGEVPFDFTSRYFAPAKGVAEDPVAAGTPSF
jgi:predicted PhzF superfamily epimerase YddE/YHI9